jgi:hypothetical protein
MRAKFRLAPHSYPGTDCSRSSFASSCPDQFTFKFGQASQDSQHQSSTWGGCVAPRVSEGLEETSLVGNGLDDGQQINCGTSQAIQSGYHHYSAGL